MIFIGISNEIERKNLQVFTKTFTENLFSLFYQRCLAAPVICSSAFWFPLQWFCGEEAGEGIRFSAAPLPLVHPLLTPGTQSFSRKGQSAAEVKHMSKKLDPVHIQPAPAELGVFH